MFLKGDDYHQMVEAEWNEEGDLLLSVDSPEMDYGGQDTIYLSCQQSEELKLFLLKGNPNKCRSSIPQK